MALKKSSTLSFNRGRSTYEVKVYHNGDNLVYRQLHRNAKEAIRSVYQQLVNLNLDSFIDTGEYIITEYLNEQYCKLFRIHIDIPNLTYDIKKITTGDINKKTFNNIIKKRGY